MDHNTDKFFERLGEHRLEPGAQAWEKIEANLSKKNMVVIWWRVAAVVAVAAVAVWWLARPVVTAPVLSKTAEAPAVQPQVQQHVPPAADEPVQATAPSTLKATNEEVAQLPMVAHAPNGKEEEDGTLLTKEVEAAAIRETGIAEIQATAALTESEVKPMVLVYELPAIETTARDVAQVEPPAEEKVSPLAKAWAVAKETKNGEGLFAELDKVKHNLFARNQKTTKQDILN
ncbi:MAG: hypothetical protein ACK5DD_08575 [Cyclobacteriaceae bacterium]|jgi:cytoskeletal protein RodZ